MFEVAYSWQLELLLLSIAHKSNPIESLFLAKSCKICGIIQVALQKEINVPHAVIFDKETKDEKLKKK